MTVIPYLLGCLAAVANAATNVMQRAANREESERLQFSLQLTKDLLHNPLWLASIPTMLASFVLQAAGLGLGSLAAIEPLLLLELPLTLIGARYFLGGRLGPREWSAIGVMTAGLVGLIAFLGPTGGQSIRIGWPVWVAAIVATALPAGALVWLALRSSSPGQRAALLGAAAGMGFGLAAALVKGMTEQFGTGGIPWRAGHVAALRSGRGGRAGVLDVPERGERGQPRRGPAGPHAGRPLRVDRLGGRRVR